MNYANSLQVTSKLSHIENILCDLEEKYYSDKDYPFQEEIYKIIGACMEVHSELGCGFLESVYQEALCIELAKRGIPFEADKLLNVFYKGTKLKKTFKSDIYAYGHIVVELKAVNTGLEVHGPQVINYLCATKHAIGVLVNFGLPSLQFKRYIVSKNLKNTHNKSIEG